RNLLAFGRQCEFLELHEWVPPLNTFLISHAKGRASRRYSARSTADSALMPHLPASSFLPFVQRNESGACRSGVLGTRTDQAVVLVLLKDVRRPAGHAADREDRREQVAGNLKGGID